MFNFFKRSKKRGNDRKGTDNRNDVDDSAAKGACAHVNKLAEPQIKSDRGVQLPQNNRQYENDSVEERAVASSLSNTPKNSFFDIMAKGRNRRNSGKNKKHYQQNNDKRTVETNRILSIDGENIKSKNAICEKLVSNDENVQWKIDRSTTAKQKCDSVDFVVKNKFQLEDQHEQLQLPLNIRNNNGVVVDIERNCVYDVRHSAENSQQKQYVGESNLDRSGALNFANAITFDKHNSPASPTTFALPFIAVDHKKPISQVNSFDEMGQQATKQNPNNKESEFQINNFVPSVPMPPIEIVPIPSQEYFQTPPSPTTDDIFFEADEHVRPVPDEDADIISNIPVVVLNEHFNFTKNDHENMCVNVNRVPSFNVIAGKTLSSADPNYDQVVINNDAIHSVCEDIPNNNDSPDSGIVDLANDEGVVDVDISKLINKLENETISSNINGGSMKSAFSSFESRFNDSHDGNINGKKFNNDGDKKKVVKKVTFEDQKSLPDVVESTNGSMVIPEDKLQDEQNNHQCNGNVK